MTEEDSQTWRPQARGRDRLGQLFGLLTPESAHLSLPVAWASHLHWLGLGFYICKMGILVVLASLGDCED